MTVGQWLDVAALAVSVGGIVAALGSADRAGDLALRRACYTQVVLWVVIMLWVAKDLAR